jgi:glycosyltransferase involved in cell wall biosynthesis
METSVIIPNFNHAEFLKVRIDSILQQTYQNFELIILDDCSTDHSKEIIESYRSFPNVRIFYNQHNSGSPFKQWKKGISLATGQYLWIAESDDLAEPLFLETMLGILKKGHGLAYCRSSDIDESGNKKSDYFWADGLDESRWKNSFENIGKDEIENFLVYRNTIPNASACVFEKKFAPLNCGFEKMRYCGDWLFWIKLVENTSLGYTPNTLSSFRHHVGSTRNKKNIKQELKKKLEIISIIESTRKEYNLGLPQTKEFEKYDWVVKDFYRQLVIPSDYKQKLIFYSNRYFPRLYPNYRRLFKNG